MNENKRKTRILIECTQCTASVQVGVIKSLRLFESAGECKLRYRDTKEIKAADILWCDIAICVRGCEYPTLRFVQAAKRAGRFLIYFLDDDLLDIPPGNESTDYFSDDRIRKYLLEIISECDLLWAVNPRITEKYHVWCERTALSRVPAVPLRQVPDISEKVHILYAGSIDHNALVREKLSPAVQRLLQEYPNLVDFVFIGADPNLSHLPGVRYYPYFESYEQYQKVVQGGEFLIGLAPMRRTSFYASKYYNKFIEYAENGIAGIYENSEPYTQIIKDGENGFLCGEQSIDWYLKLKEAVLNTCLTKQIAERSAETLCREFSFDKVRAELGEQIPELRAFRAKEVSKNSVKLPSLWVLFYLERVRLMWRLYGFMSMFVVPWKTCRVIAKTLLKWWRHG